MSTPDSNPVVPRRAEVTPRVRTAIGSASLPFDFHVKGLLRAGACGVVNLYGDAGSGKTTAAAHVADIFRDERRLVFCDQNSTDRPDWLQSDSLCIMTSRERRHSALVALEMSPWTNDDLIEYLAATHRQRVQSVMQRIANSPDRAFFPGKPSLWRIVLDVPAADESHRDITAALTWQIGLVFPDPMTRFAAQLFSLMHLKDHAAENNLAAGHLSQFDAHGQRLLAHRNVRILLAAELLIEDVCGSWNHGYLNRNLPVDLLSLAGRLSRQNSRAMESLLALARNAPKFAQSNAASILHAMKIDWKPQIGMCSHLVSAHLDGANWPDVQLPGCDATGASFFNANLSRAALAGCKFSGADFGSACLSKAQLSGVVARHACFSTCDLTGACAVGARFDGSVFRNAILTMCNLSGAVLTNADLCDARLDRANLDGVDLQGANIAGTDFQNANFHFANLSRLPLRSATLTGATFNSATLTECNLEYMQLSGSDFQNAKLIGAMMTGTVFPKANFQRANFSDAGLADIRWEFADLRAADFTGASFHAGSTRSGLVGSLIPCEGSKTGFYTDDFSDRDFKEPEEIRKASLRGADLRGATVYGVDFYLVDLRDARFTRAQRKWFVQCGAILSRA